MVSPARIELVGYGFSLELTAKRLDESWADCVALLRFETSSQVPDIKSHPFFMRRDDFERLARLLEDHLHLDCEDRFSFVPAELGFELSILDVDELEATVQIFLQVEYFVDGHGRVDAGSRGQARVSELRRFADSVVALGQSVFASP